MELFARFTLRLHSTFRRAQAEAQRLRHPYIGTEHLLLALIQEDTGVAATVLADLQITYAQVYESVDFLVGHGDRPIRLDTLQMTENASKVLAYAVEEANSRGHYYIGTEHLLLGLARHGRGTAKDVLGIMGIPLSRIRQAMLRTMERGAVQS